MIKSQYIYHAKVKDKFLLYNTLSGALLGFQISDFDKIMSILESGGELYDPEDIALRTELERCMFLVPSHDTEKDWLFNRIKKLSKNEVNALSNKNTEDTEYKKLGLIIAPTLKCNFSCSYCYQDKYNDKKPMSSKTIEDLIEFAKTFSKRYGTDKLSVVWYGGEPTLELKAIKYLTESFNKMFKETRFSMITNGYHFTKKTRDFLFDCKIKSVQITIDGDEKHHDASRMLQNGEGTYKKIIKNVYDACGENRFNIALRVNTLPQYGSIYKNLFDELKKLNIEKDISVSLAYIRNQSPDIEDRACSEVDWIKYDKEYIEYCDKNDLRRHVFLKIGRPRANVCMVSDPCNFVISPDGEIFSCLEDIGDYTNRRKPFSHLSKSFDEIISSKEKEVEYWTTGIYKHVTNHDQCSDCSYLPVCWGGVHVEHYQSQILE